MEKYLSLFVAMIVFTVVVNAQNQSDKSNSVKKTSLLELSIAENSQAPNTDKVHTYLLKVTNKTGNAISSKIDISNIACANDKSNNVSFQQNISWTNPEEAQKATNDDKANFIVQPNQSVSFYVSLIRPDDAVLNSWNCSEIKLLGTAKDMVSNIIVIETFIPNPKDFR